MAERSIEVAIQTDTVVQIGCIGCTNACTFGMNGLEGMRVVADMQMLGTDAPYSVTEMAGVLVNSRTTEATPALSTVYFNGGRTPNDNNQCGNPCAKREDIVKTAIAAEKATKDRGVVTEHMDSR